MQIAVAKSRKGAVQGAVKDVVKGAVQGALHTFGNSEFQSLGNRQFLAMNQA